MISKDCKLTEIASFLKTAKSVSLISHQGGDGDSFSSMFALNLALRKMGIDSYVCADEPLPKHLNFLKRFINFEILDTIPETEFLVVLDVSYLDKVSFKTNLLSFQEKGKKIITIDHHPGGNPEEFSNFYYLDPESAACAEIIYNLIRFLEIKIDKNIATCLMTGIESDTTGFSNLNTTARTFKIAADLILMGARLQKINNAFREISFERLQFLGKIMSRIIYNPILKTAVSYIIPEDLEGDLQSDLASGIANALNTIKDVSILFLLSEEKKGEIKVSMRTRNENINLSQFAKMLGGGGHPGAAGFTVRGSIVIENNKVKVW